MSQTKEKEKVGVVTKKAPPFHIVVYNDDVNSFEHVIETFCKYCGHTAEQANQCALIIHHKGACSVKQGDYTDLRPIYEPLLDSKLKANIEET